MAVTPGNRMYGQFSPPLKVRRKPGFRIEGRPWEKGKGMRKTTPRFQTSHGNPDPNDLTCPVAGNAVVGNFEVGRID